MTIPLLKTQPLIVVGDWAIDEDWWLVPRQSPTSSLVGNQHWEAVHGASTRFRDVCGAGLDMRLFLALKNIHLSWDVYGLGVWHDGDTETLRHLVSGCCDKQGVRSTASATIRNCGKPMDRVRLANLGNGQSTTMVVHRFFNDSKVDRHILPEFRIDRLIGAPPDNGALVDRLDELGEGGLLPPKGLNDVRIAVHDLGYMVTPQLINALLSRYPAARWYVRSKRRDTPPWVTELGARLDLLVIGPENVGLLRPWDQWLCDGRITRPARRLLADYVGDPANPSYKADHPIPEDTSLVMLSEAHEAIALTPLLAHGDDRTIVVQEMGRSTPVDRRWAAHVFCRLVGIYLARGGIDGETAARSIEEAACLSLIARPPVTVAPISRPESWQKESKAWQEWSFNKCIVKHDNEERALEVWRSYIAASEYVAVVHSRRIEINKIGTLLRDFRNQSSRKRSVSIVLCADPGSGKSTLAKSLANAFDFALIQRDVTQMIHREDLTDLFDAVATEQANRKKPVLVFVDEINSELDGGPVYGTFLSPLESNVYVRRSGAYRLEPCVWIFAGTSLGLKTEATSSGGKWKDFSDRITKMARLDFGTLLEQCGEVSAAVADLNREAQLEQVCVGASLIRERFPEATHLDESLVDKFFAYSPKDGPWAREIRKMVNGLRCVDRKVRDGEPNSPEWIRLDFRPGP